MNPAAILALIGALYAQLLDAQEEIARLRDEVERLTAKPAD